MWPRPRRGDHSRDMEARQPLRATEATWAWYRFVRTVPWRGSTALHKISGPALDEPDVRIHFGPLQADRQPANAVPIRSLPYVVSGIWNLSPQGSSGVYGPAPPGPMSVTAKLNEKRV